MMRFVWKQSELETIYIKCYWNATKYGHRDCRLTMEIELPMNTMKQTMKIRIHTPSQGHAQGTHAKKITIPWFHTVQWIGWKNYKIQDIWRICVLWIKWKEREVTCLINFTKNEFLFKKTKNEQIFRIKRKRFKRMSQNRSQSQIPYRHKISCHFDITEKFCFQCK